MIPGMSALGGGGLSASSSATATSGDAKGGTVHGSGISSPIVIGGFKTDGSASLGINPLYIVGGLAAVAVLWFISTRRR